MELTANHRVFSATRNGWVAAGDLQAGEALQAQEGAVRVRSVRESARGLTSVCNLEVYARHEFFVGEAGVRVHNGYGSAAGGLETAAALSRDAYMWEGLGQLSHGGGISADMALESGAKWVGKGYKEVAPGVFRSSDGLRQFRMMTEDLVGAHGDIGPHVHFESLNPLGRVIENNHVPLLPDVPGAP
jgi:hypothetical protein